MVDACDLDWTTSLEAHWPLERVGKEVHLTSPPLKACLMMSTMQDADSVERLTASCTRLATGGKAIVEGFGSAISEDQQSWSTGRQLQTLLRKCRQAYDC
jgi:hypothetical protein